jgi:hypothetical protein
MSTAVSDLYDGLVTILSTTFASPTYKELVNPYVPELNNDTLALARGYGFFIGPKSVVPKLGRHEGFNAEITVVQTIAQRGTERDTIIRRTAEKNLLEDQYLLIDYFRQNTAPIAKVWDISYESDNGLEFVYTDKQNYVMIRTTLRAIFSESC